MKTSKAIVKQRILSICHDTPNAANDKALLYTVYWQTYDNWSMTAPLYTNLSKATRTATIDRRLRELREAGLVQLSPKREAEVYEAFKNEKYNRGEN